MTRLGQRNDDSKRDSEPASSQKEKKEQIKNNDYETVNRANNIYRRFSLLQHVYTRAQKKSLAQEVRQKRDISERSNSKG